MLNLEDTIKTCLVVINMFSGIILIKGYVTENIIVMLLKGIPIAPKS